MYQLILQKHIHLHDEIEILNPDNTLIAKMHITDKWFPDKILEAQAIFSTVGY